MGAPLGMSEEDDAVGFAGTGGVDTVGIWDLNGDLETRLFFPSRWYVFEVRLAIWDGCWCAAGLGESRFAMRRGVVVEDGIIAPDLDRDSRRGGVAQPMPDSRRIEDLTGSFLVAIAVGELDVTLRSRSGVMARGCSLCVLIVQHGDNDMELVVVGGDLVVGRERESIDTS